MTSRGLREQDFEAVAAFLHEVCEVGALLLRRCWGVSAQSGHVCTSVT